MLRNNYEEAREKKLRIFMKWISYVHAEIESMTIGSLSAQSPIKLITLSFKNTFGRCWVTYV